MTTLLWLEMLGFIALAAWMGFAVWRSSRGDRRYGDTARFVVMLFSLFIAYRDWRILFVDTSDNAKVIMATLGICLCAFTALTARAYGRGAPLA